MGFTLFLKLFQSLAVDLDSFGSRLRQRVLLKDPAHVVEQTSDAQEYIGRSATVLLLEEPVGVGIALCRRLAEPVEARCFVVLHALAHEVQLAQHILRVLISVLRRTVKPFCRRSETLLYIFSSVIFLAQTVGGIAVSALRSGFQPAHTFRRVTHLHIIRE